MLFTDPAFFFLLLPATCALFYVVTPLAGRTAGLLVLLMVSLLCYATWGWAYFCLLLLSITVNFVAVDLLLAIPDRLRARRLWALALVEIYNFGALFWFKYRYYFEVLNTADGKPPSLAQLAIPIGISFYTFQQATLLLDAYNRDSSVSSYFGNLAGFSGKLRGYIRHAFFVAFFPHLVIGPIIYLKEFAPQIAWAWFGRLRLRDLEVGATLLVIGMFKKLVLADTLGPMADHVFLTAENGSSISALLAWMGTLAYYAQLYFDFSGYSDMALGSARMLGVRFPANFYSPLKAVGIVDFYRRWHMTLTRVISRFAFSPLALAGTRLAMGWGLRGSAARLFALWLPLLLNFEAIALWHGALGTFLLFGLIHGLWYIAEVEFRRTRAWKRWRNSTSDGLRTVLGRAFLFLPMLLTFALFRSSSVAGFQHLVYGMFAGPLEPAEYSFALRQLALPLGYFVIWFMPNSMELLQKYRPGIMPYGQSGPKAALALTWRPNWAWAGVTLLLLAVALYYMWRQPPFLYMGF